MTVGKGFPSKKLGFKMTGTRFTKENLIKRGGGYVMYVTPENPNGEFVARFKPGMGGPGTFMTHLRKNWTVEDYFARLEAGLTPLAIAALTGFVSNNMKRFLKEKGYTPNIAGYNKWKMDRDEQTRAEREVAWNNWG